MSLATRWVAGEAGSFNTRARCWLSWQVTVSGPKSSALIESVTPEEVEGVRRREVRYRAR